MVPHLPVTYDDLEIYVVHDHETKISGFKIGLHDHLNVSGAMAVGIDAHHRKAGFMIHWHIIMPLNSPYTLALGRKPN